MKAAAAVRHGFIKARAYAIENDAYAAFSFDILKLNQSRLRAFLMYPFEIPRTLYTL